jgi:hypothetical protein
VSQGGGAAELVERLAAAITVTGGRRGGDPETRIQLDHLIPPPGVLASGRARWRLATSQSRLYPPPAGRAALSSWHAAEGAKGRRLLASDLANNSRVAALLSWHFEAPSGRPHLVTSAAISIGAGVDLEAEHLTALWLLFCVTAAIDRLTVNRGEVGLVRDSAVELDESQLRAFGLTPGRKRGGYKGDYWVFAVKAR